MLYSSHNRARATAKEERVSRGRERERERELARVLQSGFSCGGGRVEERGSYLSLSLSLLSDSGFDGHVWVEKHHTYAVKEKLTVYASAPTPNVYSYLQHSHKNGTHDAGAAGINITRHAGREYRMQRKRGAAKATKSGARENFRLGSRTQNGCSWRRWR